MKPTSKQKLTLALICLAPLMAAAEDINIRTVRYAGPYTVAQPVMIDTLDAAQKAFTDANLLDTKVRLAAASESKTVLTANADGRIPLPNNSLSAKDSKSLNLVSFTLSNTSFVSAPITVKGLNDYKLYVDGKEASGDIEFEPAVHQCVIKYLSKAGTQDTLCITTSNRLTVGDSKGAKRTFTLADVMNCEQFNGVSISPNGRYLIYNTSQTQSATRTVYHSYVRDLSMGNILTERSDAKWMPRTNKYYYTRYNEGTKDYTLVTVDPLTNAETVLCDNLPQASFTFAPTEDYIIYSVVTEGPAEKDGIFEVLTPEDRQPGWRSRSNLYKFDLASGISQCLTFGYHNTYLQDISQDGKYIIYSVSEDRYTARPTTLTSAYRLNLTTMAVDTISYRDGFTSNFLFSPDGKQILAQGSPESFGGVGMNVLEGQTPSNFDYQLYLIDCSNLGAHLTEGRGVTPLTRDFNPNVGSVEWSTADGMIYFTAEDKDCENFFRLNPKTHKIDRIQLPEDMVSRYSLAASAPVMAWYGEGASNYHKLYTTDLKPANLKNLQPKSQLVVASNADRMAEIELGACEPWNWVNAEGDTICCRYYLPPHFDPSKKYPMVVNYYGGCSPTGRHFVSRYPQHAYAALGYVVLIVNPRGATGFGQKWSAVHVNTAGQGVADDIIGAVTNFCRQHEYVNDKKIGCIGASYGGFMTQYLQTVTDIFAAAVSHAGISDHTSYWGYGYWGYSYSETSMANSYPWTRKDLYVDQSPLYRADKVHTPLLFVHGTGDTNVPVNESIQMYTALKLLGRETAMVLVEGENHWILDYQKRIDWQNTIWAWFAKYLQDNDSWWESMYKHKSL